MGRKILILLLTLLLLAGSLSFASAKPDAYTLERSVISSLQHRLARNESYRLEAVVGQPTVGEVPSNGDYTLQSGYTPPPGGTPDQSQRLFLPLVTR
jgi:hypothetical protein